MNSNNKQTNQIGLIPYFIHKFLDLGYNKRLDDELEKTGYNTNLKYLKEKNNKLEEKNDRLIEENNILKSMFEKIISSEDKKEVIKEIYKENNLDIDFRELIINEIKDYVKDAVRIKLDDEEYYD